MLDSERWEDAMPKEREVNAQLAGGRGRAHSRAKFSSGGVQSDAVCRERGLRAGRTGEGELVRREAAAGRVAEGARLHEADRQERGERLARAQLAARVQEVRHEAREVQVQDRCT